MISSDLSSKDTLASIVHRNIVPFNVFVKRKKIKTAKCLRVLKDQSSV